MVVPSCLLRLQLHVLINFQGVFGHCHWEQLRILPILANLQFATVGKVCLTRANFVKPVNAKIETNASQVVVIGEASCNFMRAIGLTVSFLVLHLCCLGYKILISGVFLLPGLQNLDQWGFSVAWVTMHIVYVHHSDFQHVM